MYRLTTPTKFYARMDYVSLMVLTSITIIIYLVPHALTYKVFHPKGKSYMYRFSEDDYGQRIKLNNPNIPSNVANNPRENGSPQHFSQSKHHHQTISSSTQQHGNRGKSDHHHILGGGGGGGGQSNGNDRSMYGHPIYSITNNKQQQQKQRQQQPPPSQQDIYFAMTANKQTVPAAAAAADSSDEKINQLYMKQLEKEYNTKPIQNDQNNNHNDHNPSTVDSSYQMLVPRMTGFLVTEDTNNNNQPVGSSLSSSSSSSSSSSNNQNKLSVTLMQSATPEYGTQVEEPIREDDDQMLTESPRGGKANEHLYEYFENIHGPSATTTTGGGEDNNEMPASMITESPAVMEEKDYLNKPIYELITPKPQVYNKRTTMVTKYETSLESPPSTSTVGSNGNGHGNERHRTLDYQYGYGDTQQSGTPVAVSKSEENDAQTMQLYLAKFNLSPSSSAAQTLSGKEDTNHYEKVNRIDRQSYSSPPSTDSVRINRGTFMTLSYEKSKDPYASQQNNGQNFGYDSVPHQRSTSPRQSYGTTTAHLMSSRHQPGSQYVNGDGEILEQQPPTETTTKTTNVHSNEIEDQQESPRSVKALYNEIMHNYARQSQQPQQPQPQPQHNSQYGTLHNYPQDSSQDISTYQSESTKHNGATPTSTRTHRPQVKVVTYYQTYTNRRNPSTKEHSTQLQQQQTESDEQSSNPEQNYLEQQNRPTSSLSQSASEVDPVARYSVAWTTTMPTTPQNSPTQHKPPPREPPSSRIYYQIIQPEFASEEDENYKLPEQPKSSSSLAHVLPLPPPPTVADSVPIVYATSSPSSLSLPLPPPPLPQPSSSSAASYRLTLQLPASPVEHHHQTHHNRHSQQQQQQHVRYQPIDSIHHFELIQPKNRMLSEESQNQVTHVDVKMDTKPINTNNSSESNNNDNILTSTTSTTSASASTTNTSTITMPLITTTTTTTASSNTTESSVPQHNNDDNVSISSNRRSSEPEPISQEEMDQILRQYVEIIENKKQQLLTTTTGTTGTAPLTTLMGAAAG